MVNDITIIFGIIVFFVSIGIIAPFLNAEFNSSIPQFSTTALTDDIDEGEIKSDINAFKVFASVFSMFFWTFGEIPAFVDALIFIPLRLILALIIARNIWIGGGG